MATLECSTLVSSSLLRVSIGGHKASGPQQVLNPSSCRSLGSLPASVRSLNWQCRHSKRSRQPSRPVVCAAKEGADDGGGAAAVPVPVGKGGPGADDGSASRDVLLAQLLQSQAARLQEEQQDAERQEQLQERREQGRAALERHLRAATGQLKGTPVDPEDGPSIPYSTFRELLDQGHVRVFEYGDLGRDVAVVLPVPARASLSGGDPAGGEPVEELAKGPVVWRRFPVEEMPADAWRSAWPKLHQQVGYMQVRPPNPLLGQWGTTVGVAGVWALRAVVAFAAWRWLERVVTERFRPWRWDERPKRKMDTSTVMRMEGGFMGAIMQSRARFVSAEESTGATFDDFAGLEYVKRELQEVVKLLKDAREYSGLGVYCPKGVMLYGPPGTGKTLLARAVAGEAGVPFFSVSGTEFVEMFSGVAAARVRDLFARARQVAPSIIFIDEIDSIGSKRSSGANFDEGSAEREQGLIQLLTELDGFNTQTGNVVVMGATNRLDILDPALLRKGRFDKIVKVGLPEEDGRYAILQVHSKGKSFRSPREKEALLREVATLTDEFSGAELANVMNEAAILAVREDKDFIEKEELMRALERAEGQFSTGIEDVMDSSGEGRVRVAYREAAIALLEWRYPDPTRSFTGTDLRDMDPLPNAEYKDKNHRVFLYKEEIVDAIVRACAQYEVERLVFGDEDVAWSAATDISAAALLAEFLVLRSGATVLGPLHCENMADVVTHLQPKLVALRDEYVRFGREQCRAVLSEYQSALETIVERLMADGAIGAEDVAAVCATAPLLPAPAVRAVCEHGALVHAGRWGIHGASLPGRVTFAPGNSGYATFGAPRPSMGRIFSDETWNLIDDMIATNMAAVSEESRRAQGPRPQLVLADTI